jgi:hypothetical protein
MLMEKIRCGVLQVATDAGVRYVQPSFGERVQLLWTFRNFHVLSEEILTRHERHLVNQLCAEERLRRIRNGDQPPACVIGTLELHAVPIPKKSVQSFYAQAQKNSA